MTATAKHLFAATLLAAASTLTWAQTPPPAPGAAAAQQAQPDAGQRQQRWAERRARHLADLKAKLQISAAQEGAWASYTAALQPPAPEARMNRGEFQQLTTPQRIDRMQQRMAERSARMQQMGDATKAFYAQLTPEQQKIFDQQPMGHGRHGKGHGPAMMGGPGR